MTDTVVLKKKTVAAMEQYILDIPPLLERIIAEKDEKIDQLRGALKVIQSVLPSKTPGNSDEYILEICRKYLTPDKSP